MITPEALAKCLEITGLTPEELLEKYDFMSPAEQVELEQILTAELSSNGVPDNYLAWLPSSLPNAWTAYAPHFPIIGRNLDKLTCGEIDRLAIHMPPRHGKTSNITVRYAVYYLLRNPSHNVLITGYNAAFARRLSRMARKLAAQYGILDTTKKSVDEWHTVGGGQVVARGVGQPPTGIGFHLIIIDDPIKRRQDAESETIRSSINDWYTDDIYTRLEPGGKIVLVMTLWHEEDIGYYAVETEPGKWTRLVLPALAEPTEDAPDPLGRKEGEALWPARYPREDLLRTKAVISAKEGERSWNALYQQRPAAREGSFFHPDKILTHDGPLPPMRRVLRIWDLAATKDGGDYTVGLLLGVDINGRIWILDMVRGQYESDTRRNTVRATAEGDGIGVMVLGPEEPGAAGKDVALDFVRLLMGYNVKIKPTSQAKELRAFSASAQVNAGNVSAVNARWLPTLKSELRSFPTGKHDDIVDALADGVNEIGAIVTIRTSSISSSLIIPQAEGVMPMMPATKHMPFDRKGLFIPPTRSN